MKGSYNAVTQSASGEVTRTDYQESRKNTALSGGLVLAGIALVAVVIWYFWNQIKETVGGIIPKIPTGSVPPSTVSAANSMTPAPTSAVNNQGQYYPVKTLTKQDYDDMLKSMGMLEPVVKLGNAITPPAVLDGASAAGAEAAATVNKLGLNNAYCDLPDIQKGLVTLGEGIGKLAGVDLIQAGYDMRSAIASSHVDGGA